MDKVFQKLLDNNFTDLTGLVADVSIPVPEHIMNEIIDATIQEARNVTYARLSIGGQNRVALDLKTPLWPWPLHLKLKLFRSVDLAGSPKVRAFLENHVLLGRLGSLLKALPPGIHIYQDQVVVDVGAFLQTPEQQQVLALLKSLEVRTEPAKIILEMKIEVD